MKKVAQELGFIAELPGGMAVLTLSHKSPLASLPEEHYDMAVAALLTLARAQLMKEYQQAPAGFITVSPDPAHTGAVTVIRLLLTPRGEYQILTYFGDQAHPRTKLSEGLLHAAQIIAVIEQQAT